MPIWQKPILTLTYEAEVAITHRMVVVEGTADGQVNDPAGANAKPFGVAQNAAAAGEMVDVAIMGAVEVIASAAISRGALVAISTVTGRVAAVTVGTTTADERILGRALSAAAADGDILSVLLLANDYVQV